MVDHQWFRALGGPRREAKSLVLNDLGQEFFHSFRTCDGVRVPQLPTRPVEGLAGLIDDALDVVQRAPLCADVPGDVLKTTLDASDINAGVRRTRCF